MNRHSESRRPLGRRFLLTEPFLTTTPVINFAIEPFQLRQKKEQRQPFLSKRCSRILWKLIRIYFTSTPICLAVPATTFIAASISLALRSGIFFSAISFS